MLYVAAGIMLAHNAIPHNHEDDYSQLQIKKAEINCCFANWFKSVLQLDFGQEHLEVFNQGKEIFSENKIQDFQDYLAYNSTPGNAFIPFLKQIIALYNGTEITDQQIGKIRPSRAPPTIS